MRGRDAARDGRRGEPTPSFGGRGSASTRPTAASCAAARSSWSRPGPGRARPLAARGGPAAGAAGQGRDPDAARPRPTQPVCERIVAGERVYMVPRPDGRLIVGATVEERGLRHHGHRRRRPRAAARGLPAAARGRRAGAGRGARRGCGPGTPGQRAADRRRARGRRACCSRPATTATACCWRPLTADAVAALLAGEHRRWRSPRRSRPLRQERSGRRVGSATGSAAR